MRAFLALYRKDMKALFGSPVAYVILAAFSLLSGLFFYRGMLFFSALSAQTVRGQAVNANLAVFRPLFSNYVFILVLLVPLVTMRLFSEERKSGTLELLGSYPAAACSVVLAKYACGLSTAACGLGMTLPFPVAGCFLGVGDWAPVVSAYAGLLLAASALTAIGVFFSSVTDNQIIAASAALGASSAFWIGGGLGRYVAPFLGRLVGAVSFHERAAGFIRGVVGTVDAFFFVNVTAAALVFTIMSLRSQRFGG